MNLEQSLYDRIGYYASDIEHPDPNHPLHEVPGRPTLKKKKQGGSQTSAARPGSSRADTSTKSKVATKTREDASEHPTKSKTSRTRKDSDLHEDTTKFRHPSASG